MSKNSGKPSATKSATVKKIIPSLHPELPEKAEIEINGCDDLYRELRIENKLKDSRGKEVRLKKDAHVEVTIKADPADTTGT